MAHLIAWWLLVVMAFSCFWTLQVRIWLEVATDQWAVRNYFDFFVGVVDVQGRFIDEIVDGFDSKFVEEIFLQIGLY